MAQFTVEPAALEAYAKIIGSTGGGSKTLQADFQFQFCTYADTWVKIDGPGMVFHTWLKPEFEKLHDQITQDASAIADLLVNSATGLESSASVYRTTEKAQARHIDAIYKSGKAIALDDELSTSGPVTDPVSELKPPSDEGGVPDLAQEILDSGGILSLSDLVLKILKWCGLDVIGWVRDKFIGDPRDISKAGNALENLGSFHEDAANEIAIGATTMFKSWSGSAADAARSYFDQLANVLDDYGSQLSALQSRMEALVIGINEGVSAIEGALTTAIDAGIKAATAVAAAGCLADVPGIDVVAAIAGAVEVENVYGAIRKFFDIWNVIWAGNEGVFGLITGLVGGLTDFNLSGKLPQTNYYNGSQTTINPANPQLNRGM